MNLTVSYECAEYKDLNSTVHVPSRTAHVARSGDLNLNSGNVNGLIPRCS